MGTLIKYTTYALIILLLASCGEQINKKPLTGDFESDLKQLLPDGAVEVDIMGFQVPVRFYELQEKLKKGIAENQAWFTEYIKTAKSANKYDYHPNLGLTKEELEELNHMTGQMEMVKGSVSFIWVTHTDSTIEIVGSEDTEGFEGFNINLKTKRLTTDYASINFTRAIEANEHQDKTGPWNGYNWKYQQLDTANLTDLINIEGKDYDFSIGQLVESKKAIIFFKAREFSDGKQVRMADLLLTYNIPQN